MDKGEFCLNSSPIPWMPKVTTFGATVSDFITPTTKPAYGTNDTNNLSNLMRFLYKSMPFWYNFLPSVLIWLIKNPNMIVI